MTLAATNPTAPPAQLSECAEARAGAVLQIVDLSAAGQMALNLTAPFGPNLSEEDRLEADRRLKIIEPLINPGAYPLLWSQLTRKGAVIDWISKQHGVKRRTIYRWLDRFEQHGIAGLVPRDRSDKGTPRALNGAALDFLIVTSLPQKGCYGKLSVREIYRAYLEERAWRAKHADTPLLDHFGQHKYHRYLDPESSKLVAAAQLPEASYETFRNWFNRIPEMIKVMGRSGEEAFSNSQEVISFRDLTKLKPLDYVVMDHRRLDIFCLVRDKSGWKLIRPWLTAAIDMRTRKWLSWGIVESPSSDSIASVLKRCILDWGVPSAVYWDNGKDFTSSYLEGGSSKSGAAYRLEEMSQGVRGVLDTLGIRVHHAIVKRARSKIIEPNFLNVANFDRALPWWCGHTPSARPERFEALVTQHEKWLKSEANESPFIPIGEIAILYDEKLRSLNETPHSGVGMVKINPTGPHGWYCPNEIFELLIPQVPRKTVDAATLQFCFWRRRVLKVRNGEVRATFGGESYHYRLQESTVALMSLNGLDIEIAFDPFDLGTAAVYHQHRFVGMAQNAELRRMGEDTFVQDEKDRRGARREVKKFIAAIHSAVPVPDYKERSSRRRAVLPVRTEPERAQAPCALPAGIVAAARAAADETKFSFEASDGADVIREADRSAYRDEDTAFQFFKDK
jgi:transposase